MILKGKVAVIYAAGGAVGSSVARAFAGEGAKLFLTGRNLASVEKVAKEIASTGAFAEAAEVDALNEDAIGKHLQSVIEKAGRVDISFNAVGLRNTTLQGVPLAKLAIDQFLLPIDTYVKSYLLTARQAANRMAENKSGVIMTVTSTPSRIGIPLMGGVAPAMAAVEALTRNLSAELVPQGISRGRSATPRNAGIRHDQGSLRSARSSVGYPVGSIPRPDREQDPRPAIDDAYRDGGHGGLHGVRSGERDHRYRRQHEPGKPRRLAVAQVRLARPCHWSLQVGATFEAGAPPGSVCRTRFRRM